MKCLRGLTSISTYPISSVSLGFNAIVSEEGGSADGRYTRTFVDGMLSGLIT